MHNQAQYESEVWVDLEISIEIRKKVARKQ